MRRKNKLPNTKVFTDYSYDIDYIYYIYYIFIIFITIYILMYKVVHFLAHFSDATYRIIRIYNNFTTIVIVVVKRASTCNTHRKHVCSKH